MGIFDIFNKKPKKAAVVVSKVKNKKKIKHSKKKSVSKKAIKKHKARVKKVKEKKKDLKKEKVQKLKALRMEKFEKLKRIKEERIAKLKKIKEDKIKNAKEEKLKKEKEQKLKKVQEKKLKEEKLKKQKLEKEKKSPVKQVNLFEKKIKGDGKLEYYKTYVPGFDELINPGIPKGSSILVEGGPGSGKTLFCLTALKEMCKKGSKVLYMSFEEPEDRLRNHIRSFGVNVEELERKGLLYIKRFNALDIARSVEALLSEAKKELLIDVQPVLIPGDFKADVILVDSLTSISSAFSGEMSRFRIYMEQLFRYLEAHKISSFLVREVPAPTHIGNLVGREQEEAVSFLSDGIIAIYNVFFKNGVRKRAIEVLKMRGVNINRKVVEYEITPKGVIVHSNRPLKGDYQLT